MSVLIKALSHNFNSALTQLQMAVDGCADDLWEADIWPDEAPTTVTTSGAIRGSSPWLLAHHALICLDYDLVGDFDQWSPPPPMDGAVGADPVRLLSKRDILGYVDYCRSHTHTTLDGLTETMADRPLPASHRYEGTRYGVLIGSIPLHVVEHATQIDQFCRRHTQRS